MKHYMVVVEHTPDECLRTMDELADNAPELLDEFWFAGAAGEHKGWAIVDADSEEDALEKLPPALRDGADVVPVRHYSMQSVKALHRMAA